MPAVVFAACVGGVQEGPQAPQDDLSTRASAATGVAFKTSDFMAATACKSCHPVHYDEWSGSNHSHAMADPVFMALLERQRIDEVASGTDRFCTGCHSPIGTKSGEINQGFALEQLSPVVQEGVTCAGCHHVTGLQDDPRGESVITPSSALQGPYADARSPHATQLSSVLVASSFCGSCHDVVSESGVRLESPYAEWLASPGGPTKKSCQSCHMPEYAGVAASLEGTALRPNIHRHTFTGADVPAAVQAAGGPRLAAQREESLRLLQSAASLFVRANSFQSGGPLTLEVTINNLIEGHQFPTGSSFFRQFWLTTRVEDMRGERVFSSGEVDAAGDIFDRHHIDGEKRDPQLVRLGTYLLDESGRPTLLPWRAVSAEREAIAPGTSEAYHYSCALREGLSYPLTVEVRLSFRSYSPMQLRQLGLSELAAALDVIEIARASTIIPAP
ncbi:MAG: cytochrome c family protein [Myxococcaceae bacterium]|nr:cytochrome c family protein [Myxococcaceae bacterium]